MDWKPRYPQPFTAAQLRELDVPTITQEISRLDNSLTHLGRTQKELHDHLSENPDDEEVSKAMVENQHVIAAQMERSFMLKMSLEERGINTLSTHYAPSPSNGVASADSSGAQEPLVPLEHPVENVDGDVGENSQDGGIYL